MPYIKKSKYFYMINIIFIYFNKRNKTKVIEGTQIVTKSLLSKLSIFIYILNHIR